MSNAKAHHYPARQIASQPETRDSPQPIVVVPDCFDMTHLQDHEGEHAGKFGTRIRQNALPPQRQPRRILLGFLTV